MGVPPVAPIERSRDSDDVSVPTTTAGAQRVADQQPHQILSPIVLGPSQLIQSSASLPWRGVLLEKHTCSPGERPDGNTADRPVVAMLCSPTWRGEHKSADGTFALHNKTLGALTVVPKGPLPAARSMQKYDLAYCALDDSLIAGVADELEGRRPPLLGKRLSLHDRAMSGILNLLLLEVESGAPSGALYVDSLAHALAVRLLFLGEGPPGQSRRTAGLPHRKLSRIQELIESHLEEDLTLQELAAEAGYSRSHFLRMFHATTGMPPHRYVLKRRIERARRLLAQPEISLAEIAYSCGFSSQPHFTRAFRGECGLTPAAYRRQL